MKIAFGALLGLFVLAGIGNVADLISNTATGWICGIAVIGFFLYVGILASRSRAK